MLRSLVGSEMCIRDRSVTVAVFVTSSSVVEVKLVIVLSSVVFPSLSLPSSLISVTSFVFPGLEAVTVTLFLTLPVSNTA